MGCAVGRGANRKLGVRTRHYKDIRPYRSSADAKTQRSPCQVLATRSAGPDRYVLVALGGEVSARAKLGTPYLAGASPTSILVEPLTVVYSLARRVSTDVLLPSCNNLFGLDKVTATPA